MRHAPPKSVERHTCHKRWSFHLKCGKDHDGYHQIHGVPKGSLGSHLGLRNPVHIGHYVLDSHHFEFLGDALPTTALIGLGEPDDRYAFPATYRDAKAFER
jgi:hypothetical protein